MHYPVVVEERREGHFRALIPFLPECAGEGMTEEAARHNLREVVEKTVTRLKLTTMEFDTSRDEEWSDFGMFRDDPTWGRIFDEIEQERNSTREMA